MQFFGPKYIPLRAKYGFPQHCDAGGGGRACDTNARIQSGIYLDLPRYAEGAKKNQKMQIQLQLGKKAKKNRAFELNYSAFGKQISARGHVEFGTTNPVISTTPKQALPHAIGENQQG